MKYYLIAGEASGDLHGANLMRGIQATDPKAEFRFWGGDLMQEVGGTLVRHYKDTAVMGLWEVITSLRKIRRNLNNCKQDIVGYRPDVLILIDYAGFNLRIAEYIHTWGKSKVFYYISPKLWAWKQSRVKKVQQFVDKMFVIFPFEVDFYKRFEVDAEFYGHPLMDAVEKKGNPLPFVAFVQKHRLDERPIIALLAGSRKQEIHWLLPEMLKLIPHYEKKYQFVIAGAPSMQPENYAPYIKDHDVKIVYGQTYELLQQATAAVVTSGTATLETALFEVPQIVLYKTSPITYHIGKQFVKIKFFSLVNLIMDKEVVKELLQFDIAEDSKQELDRILFETPYREQMIANYKTLKAKLGKSGASHRVGEVIFEKLKKGEIKNP